MPQSRQPESRGGSTDFESYLYSDLYTARCFEGDAMGYPKMSPPIFEEHDEMHMLSSNSSTASVSTVSSATGSPRSSYRVRFPLPVAEWAGPPGPGPGPGQGHPMPPPLHVMPPMPPKEIIPAKFQRRPNVEICDLRHERVTEKDARDHLSSFVVARFEKVKEDDTYDLHEKKMKSTWMNVRRTFVKDYLNADIKIAIRRLNKETLPVLEKKKTLEPNQQRQVEKAIEDLMSMEPEPQLYHYELVQLDAQRRHVESKHHHHHHHHHHHSSSHGSRSRHQRGLSIGLRDHKKKTEVRSLVAYYRRCPRPEANALVMFQEFQARRNVLLPQQQAFLQQFHIQNGDSGFPPGAAMRGPPQGNSKGGNGGQGKGEGGGGGGSIIKMPDGKRPPKMLRDHSNSDSRSDFSDDSMFDDDNRSRSTDAESSHPRHGRRPHEERPFLEHRATHFGIVPNAPIRRHRGQEDANYLDSPRMIPAALQGLGVNPGVVIKITPRGVGKKKLMGYTFVVKGKCTTCSRVFSNPQDFYEHLDDYVLRVVAQQGFSVPVNTKPFEEDEKKQLRAARTCQVRGQGSNLPASSVPKLDADMPSPQLLAPLLLSRLDRSYALAGICDKQMLNVLWLLLVAISGWLSCLVHNEKLKHHMRVGHHLSNLGSA